MNDTRCPLTELYVDQCAHCRGIRLDLEATGDTMVARYPGKCFGCGRDTRPGDLITAYATGYICTDCGTET